MNKNNFDMHSNCVSLQAYASRHQSDEQEQAVALLMQEAEKRGFVAEDDLNLKFEPWLVSQGISPPNFFANLALVDINPAAHYVAVISPVFSVTSYFMVCSMEPIFQYGEEWKYSIRVDYIGTVGSQEGDAPVFDSCDHNHGAIKLVVAPGMDEYEISLECGLSADFLRSDVREAVYGLTCLLALQAFHLSAD